MIEVTNNGIDHVLNGMADKFDLIQKQTVKLFPAEEDRDWDVCCHHQSVLADATGIAHQNDINGFMFQVGTPTDTLEMYLDKSGVQVAQLNSTTYGTYYALGSITYYTDQALLTGYILEWSKVLAAHGIGDYQVRVILNTFGGATTESSNIFNLRTYSTDKANGTIRIESYMDGYIMKDRINYKGLNFPDMLRVRGFFGNPEEKIETTNDVYANYSGNKRVVVQRKVNQYDLYPFETLPIPKCVTDKIRYYHFLGNTVYISDYNIFNYDYTLQKKQIFKDEAFTFKYTKTSRGVIIKGKLTEQVQDLQKTNC
jgi:hypothetical protein